MKNIKLSFPYPDWPLFKQSPMELGVWGDCKFFINPKNSEKVDFDYWFVYNFPLDADEITACKKGGLVLITGEPDSVETYSRQYTNQFDCVITSQKGLKHPNKFFLSQGLPWHVKKSYDELVKLQPVPKERKISIISSNKIRTEGHQRRLDFALRIKDYFKERIDLYGRGLNSFEDKWEALAPYEYSISVENSAQEFYFTEKLTDCFLSFTYPIYYGCLNIHDYFDKRSYIQIDINKFDLAVKRIETVLVDSDHYSANFSYLMNARDKALNCYNLLPLIVDFVSEYLEKSNEKSVSLRQVKRIDTRGFLRRVVDKIY
jgi:hypothetical protein